MLPLLLAALLWVGLHLGIAGTAVRAAFVTRVGERGFTLGFSVASAVSITLLVLAWQAAPATPLWMPPRWLGWALVALMLPAFILFAGSVMTRNATSVGQNEALAAEPRGMLRVTRHPMLWSFALWGLIHVIGNGDPASAIFFGAFAVTGLAGMPSLDAKVAARDPAGWAGFAARTSVLPFGAIVAGRNRLVASELLWPVGVGAVAWAALLHLHPVIFGVSPLPYG